MWICLKTIRTLVAGSKYKALKQYYRSDFCTSETRENFRKIIERKLYFRPPFFV